MGFWVTMGEKKKNQKKQLLLSDTNNLARSLTCSDQNCFLIATVRPLFSVKNINYPVRLFPLFTYNSGLPAVLGMFFKNTNLSFLVRRY